nr:pyridoxal-phosphate dependent enzyme [Candidatus Korarchaeota archaeon]
KLNLIENSKIRVTGAQPQGCSPVVTAFKSNADEIFPVEKPNTIAKSLAVGDPGDGIYAVRRIRESGGVAESVTDEETIDAIKLLAKTEGIFTEPAGGVTIAVLKKLTESGEISIDEKIVCYVTGNGLKTPETIFGHVSKPVEIEPRLESLTTLTTLRGV